MRGATGGWLWQRAASPRPRTAAAEIMPRQKGLPVPVPAGIVRAAADGHQGARSVAAIGVILKRKSADHRSLRAFLEPSPEFGKCRQ